MHGYTSDKDAYLKRLRRIEGQIRGLQRMVENDEYCIDVLTQIAAATKALQAVSLGLLDEHLKHCVAQAAAEGGPVAEDRAGGVGVQTGLDRQLHEPLVALGEDGPLLGEVRLG